MSIHHAEPRVGGYWRRRTGRGFTYRSADGVRLTDPAELARIKELVIPPAWHDVWVSGEADAHIQAVGLDNAGRTQYIYHPAWREQQDEEKYARSLAFAGVLPKVRGRVTRDLSSSDERTQALAAAIRMIDSMALRVGGEQYAEENGSFGASTLRRRHVMVLDDTVRLTFRGKSGGDWDVYARDAQLAHFFETRPKTPSGGPALCWSQRRGRRRSWHGISASDINAYLGQIAGGHFTAKDFRTWQGTVVMAGELARAAEAGETAPGAVTSSVRATAEYLHNTPAVARDSYINPLVTELFEMGVVVQGKVTDKKVLKLLAG